MNPPADLLVRPDLDAGLRAYVHFRGLRRLPVRLATVVQFVVGVVASLVVFFVQMLLM